MRRNRLTERDLSRIVKRVVKEQKESMKLSSDLQIRFEANDGKIYYYQCYTKGSRIKGDIFDERYNNVTSQIDDSLEKADYIYLDNVCDKKYNK